MNEEIQIEILTPPAVEVVTVVQPALAGGTEPALVARVDDMEDAVAILGQDLAEHGTRLSVLEAGGGSGGGTSVSRPMRIAQQLLHRANFTMGNNAFVSGDSTSGGTVTAVGVVPFGYGRGYPASLAQAPMSYYGAQVDMEGWGVRPSTSQWTETERNGNVAWAEFGVYGDSFVIELERGYPYRVMVEEKGVDRYLPDAQIMNEAGTSFQYYRVQFPSRARRIITIECNRGDDSKMGRIGALYVETADGAAFRIARKKPKICLFGDSALQGEPPWGGGAGLGSVVSHCLGVKDALVSVNHSTGVYGAVGGLTSLRWGLRRSDWRNFAPDVMVFRSSAVDLNFGVAAATIASMMKDEIVAVRAALPSCIIMLLGLIEYPAGHVYFDQKRLDINAAARAAIASLDDPFIKWVDSGAMPLDYWEEEGTGNQGSPGNDGPRSFMVQANEHWSREGDLMTGLSLAETVRSVIEGIVFGTDSALPPVDLPASIAPATASVNLVQGTPYDLLLGTISYATTTGSPVGAAPAGMEFVYAGQQLRLQGTPSGLAGSTSVQISGTTNDGDISFGLTYQVTAAPVASIAPTSRNLTLTVEVPIDMVLGTVSNGVPSGVTGAVPSGTIATIDGQDVKLTGTPDTEDADISSTLTIATNNGSVELALTGSVAAASGGGAPSDPLWSNVTMMAVVQNGQLVDLTGRHTFDMQPAVMSSPATISGNRVVFSGAQGVRVLGDQSDFEFGPQEELAIDVWAAVPASFTSTGVLFDGYADAVTGSYQAYLTHDGTGNGAGIWSKNNAFEGNRTDASFTFMRDGTVAKYTVVRAKAGDLMWTQFFVNDVFVFEKAGDAELKVGPGGFAIGYQTESPTSRLVGEVLGMRVTKANPRYAIGNMGFPGDPTITSDTFEQALAASLPT